MSREQDEVVDVLRQLLSATQQIPPQIEDNRSHIAVLNERVIQLTTILTRIHRLIYEGNGSSLIQTIAAVKSDAERLEHDLKEILDKLSAMDKDRAQQRKALIATTITAMAGIISAAIVAFTAR